MEKTVLVTAIGSFAADAVIRELKRLSYRVVGCDIYEADWVAQSKDVDVFYQAPAASDAEAYLAFLKDCIAKEHIDFIVPLIDVEVDLLNAHRAELEAFGVVLCMSDEARVTVLRDKLKLNKEVKGVLKKLKKSEGKDAVRAVPTQIASRTDYEKLSYPIILKPMNGRSSIGLYRIYHEDQLGFAFSCIEDPNVLNDTTLDSYLVQPLIKGNVVTVDVVRDRAGHVMCAAREELLRTQNGAGLSVRVFEDALLTSVCRKLADALSIVGCVNFEFVKGEGSGVYYFLECNPRFSGGVAFSLMAGMPAVEAAMTVFAGGEIADGCMLDCGNFARKYVECRM